MRRSSLHDEVPNGQRDQRQQRRRSPPEGEAEVSRPRRSSSSAPTSTEPRSIRKRRRIRPASGSASPRELDWFKPWKKTLEWKAPNAKWFVGGKLNVAYNCLDRHVATAPQTRPPSSGRASRATRGSLTYRDLYREVEPLRRVPEAPRASRRATGSPSTCRWCPSCRSRCWPAPGSARRTPSSSAASPPRRCATASTTRSPRVARSPPTAATGAAAWSRSRRTRTRRSRVPDVEHVVVLKRDRRRTSTDAGRRPRRLVARLRQGRARRLRAREDGRRGPALHPLHLGHHRQAEGHRPHHRRLPGRASTRPPSGSST